MIRGAEVVHNVKTVPIGTTPRIHANNPATFPLVPEKESQARPLTKLPADKQPEAWAKAVESAGGNQPTAKQVEAVVNSVVDAMVKKPERLPKYTPAIAVDIANNAIRMLGTIHDTDTRREEALRMVITYCETELN
jgi:hypothetical protein